MEPLGTSSTFNLPFLSLNHTSLHRWLPSSYAYWLIMLQRFSLTGMLYGGDNTAEPGCTYVAFITERFEQTTNAVTFWGKLQLLGLIHFGVFFLVCYFYTDSKDCQNSPSVSLNRSEFSHACLALQLQHMCQILAIAWYFTPWETNTFSRRMKGSHWHRRRKMTLLYKTSI